MGLPSFAILRTGIQRTYDPSIKPSGGKGGSQNITQDFSAPQGAAKLVHLVCLVHLVYLVSLIQPIKRDKANKREQSVD